MQTVSALTVEAVPLSRLCFSQWRCCRSSRFLPQTNTVIQQGSSPVRVEVILFCFLSATSSHTHTPPTQMLHSQPPEAMATLSPWLHTIATPSTSWRAAGMSTHCRHQWQHRSAFTQMGTQSWSAVLLLFLQLVQWNKLPVEKLASQFPPVEVKASHATASWTITVEMKTSGICLSVETVEFFLQFLFPCTPSDFFFVQKINKDVCHRSIYM